MVPVVKGEHESLLVEPFDVLLAAAKILRDEAEKDASRSKNDQAELRIAAAVCEGVAARGETIPEALEAEKRLAEALLEYADRWVAVRDHEVVASAETLGALLRMIGPENDVDGVFHVLPAGTDWL